MRSALQGRRSEPSSPTSRLSLGASLPACEPSRAPSRHWEQGDPSQARKSKKWSATMCSYRCSGVVCWLRCDLFTTSSMTRTISGSHCGPPRDSRRRSCPSSVRLLPLISRHHGPGLPLLQMPARLVGGFASATSLLATRRTSGSGTSDGGLQGSPLKNGNPGGERWASLMPFQTLGLSSASQRFLLIVIGNTMLDFLKSPRSSWVQNTGRMSTLVDSGMTSPSLSRNAEPVCGP
jgi:hypothetical protein